MTDELEAVNAQDVNSPADINVKSEVSDDGKKAQVFDNETVQKVVARERMKAYEKGKRDKEMELQQQQEAMQQQQQQPVANQMPQSFGGIPQMSPEQLEQMIAEKAQQHLQEQIPQYLQGQMQQHQNQQMVDSFVSKMSAAEQKYPGIEAKLSKLDYGKQGTLALIQMANNLENTGDIMQELLVTNPMKFGQIVNLIYEQPELAQEQLASLSNSIKQNQDALAQHEPANNPLGQMKPSTIAGMDNGNMSVSDFSNYFRNKRRR